MSYYDYIVDRFFCNHLENQLQLEAFKKYNATGRNSIWTCKDGTKVRIRDMSDQHLENTIKMLEKKDPTHEALTYLKYERRYRAEYLPLKAAIETEEDIIDNVL